MSQEENDLIFPIERTSAVKLLGTLWSGSVSGQILVGIMLFIGVLFMGKQGFNVLSIAFFVGFIFPMSLLMHKKIVTRGKKLMKPWCDIKYEDSILNYRTGFPNTTNPDWQAVKIDKTNRDLVIRGHPVGGYHLRLNGEEIIRLGLWLNIDDAREGANKLSSLLKGKVTEDLSEVTTSEITKNKE